MKIELHGGGKGGRLRLLGVAAFTIVEMWISMAVGSVVMGAAGVVYLQVAKEQRIGLADAVLEQQVDLLQDKLIRLFQMMSATEGAVLGMASTNSAMYRLAVVSTGAGKPQQRVFFSTDNQAVYLDPNNKVAGDETILWKSESKRVILRDLYFTVGLKEGYRPDASIINVNMILDDDSSSQRRSGASYKANQIRRQFSVRMRGP